ncbi:MAG: hypothetical protein F4X64_17335 [Chloroflexi bacterium]|nr:hypothetical protein [Chloroflexota bacterium]
MDRFFESPDLSGFPPLNVELVNDVLLSSGDRSVSELLMLYFACVTSDPDEQDFIDATERIALVISDRADDGDEEAMMAMVALGTLESDDDSEEATIVGAAMLQAVGALPILRNVIAGEMDYEAAAPPLMMIKMLADHALLDVLDPDDGLEDLDFDDIDLDQLASDLGVPGLDLDYGGGPNDR